MAVERVRRGSKAGQFAPAGYYTHDDSANWVSPGASVEAKIAAAAVRNRVVVLTYRKRGKGHKSLYRVEPYSYRIRAEKKFFFAYDLDSETIKSFDLSRISNVRIQDERFEPRWKVEIRLKSGA